MKILVLGASSYVGARIYFDLKRKYEVTGTYSSNKLSEKFVKLDITDREAVLKEVADIRPDVIVHSANNANARWCEANPEAAQLLNVKSTEYIVDAANLVNAKLVYISSFAAMNLGNVYGRSKLSSEEITKKTKAGWIILRPSYIVGYSPNTVNDRPFNRLLRNLDDGVKAEYDTSWKFQATWVGHLSGVIAGCIENNIVNEMIPVASPELKSRFDVANDILTPLGVTVHPVDKKDSLPVTSDDLSKLKALKLPVYTYREMVDRIIEEIKARQSFTV
jgi:dTDP-4-dehydrorhamnose reductase